ncbi:MAG: carboxypeptidase-like regulatory domain-containing protein [Thermoanaerobaculia bacterium]
MSALAAAGFVLLAPFAAPAEAAPLGSASLQIAGTRLTVSPASQTVPFDVPTIVETHLEGYDAANGVLPQDLRVRGDLTGPEVDGVLVLETVPDEPFQIPRLRLEGDYLLDNIRLVQGEALLAYAEPRSAAVLVTQVVVTSVRSRPLTLDEIRHFGLVIDDDSFTALNLTFGFGVDGSSVIEYNMPLIYRHYGPEGRWESPLASVPLPQFGEGTAPPSARFIPPQLIPFEIELEYEELPEIPHGGCPPENGECRTLFPPGPPLVGVILFPTDISLLHQFFSVVLMVQNGAPEADPLVLRDVVARIGLPQGLRQSATEPPTPLGVPVPVRVPGPDGELGTGDDLNFIVAQASGDAVFLVEGLKEGTHVVEFDVAGILEGLPGGRIQRVTGRARGAVIVRDPTLSVTITHPHTVRAQQEYSLFLTVSNNGNTPVNLLSLKLPVSGLSGVDLAAGEVNEKTIPELLPGDSEVVEFELLSRLTGKVVASSVKSGSAISPNFEWAVAVGEDIPLSPNTLSLPASTHLLPAELVRAGLGLIGLGHSAATAPRSQLSVGSIRVGREVVNERIYRLAQAGRHVKLGEELFEAAAILASEFSGARDVDWEWDRLRRETLKGGQMAAAFGAVLAAEETDRATAFDRFARATHFLHPQAAMAEGSGVVLEVMSRTSGKRIFGTAADPDDPQRSRELPFAELYGLGGAELATMTVPEAGGYRVLVRNPAGGSADLHLLVPDEAGSLRVVRWPNVSLTPDTVAFVDFDAADTSFFLQIDVFGDGILGQPIPGTVTSLTPRPFEALAAVQNAAADPSGHVIDVLMSSDVDLQSLLPRDPNRFTIPGKVSNGGLIEMELDAGGGLLGQPAVGNPLAGLQNTRVLRVVFDNPLSPLIAHTLTIRDLIGVEGEELVQQTIAVQTTVTQPGIQVEGQVIGPDGGPVPFAEVAVFEYDSIGRPPSDLCIEHRTATVVADAAGRFHFDYVRQTECGDVFRIAARDLIEPKWGEARGRVRFVGSTQTVDVIMIGRGTVRGRVTYEDATVPPGVRVVAHNPVFDEGRLASVDANGNYLANDVMVGTVTLAAHDPEGRIVYQTIEIPQAGSVVERALVILRLDSSPPPTGEVRGTVYELDGTTPAYNAYVALYVDGQLIASERSGVDGTFDFGVVPAGVAELEAFDAVSGRSGAQHFFEIDADQVTTVDLYLRADRGTVQGHVYRQQIDGTVSPLAGAVVWAEGAPFNTTTDGAGFYVLEDVFAGNWSIQAADLDTGQTVSAAVTVTSTGGVVDRDLYFFAELPAGGITGEVLDYVGQPVAGARVHLAGDYYSVRWNYEVYTNELGRFAIPGVGPGIYGVHAIASAVDGGVGFATVRFPGDTPFVTVRFRKGTIKVKTVKLDSNDELSPVVSTLVYRTTKVVPEWDLVVLDKDFTTRLTDGQDFVVIPDVLVGPYEIYVYTQFHTAKNVTSALEVHGQENEHTFTFEDNGTIRGVVYDVDGTTPVPDVAVSLEGELIEAGGYVVDTDAEGRFTFDLVPPGSYTVKVHWESGVVFRQQQISVYMGRFGEEIDVEITLPGQGSVIGLVQDATGDWIEGAVVTLSERGYPFRVMVSNADEDGNFQFDNVFASEISLRAQAPATGRHRRQVDGGDRLRRSRGVHGDHPRGGR